MSLTQCWSLFLSRSLIMGLCPSKTPLVSIVIPVFNVEKYLRKCLDSLLQQTLHDIEIVCVNDCSTDTSREILSHYAQLDERICIIDLPENRKQGGARNAGIRHSHAPFITFVDSDDWIEPTMCECLYANALAHDADWVCSDYFVYNSPDDCQRQLNGHPSWFDLPRDERNKSFLLGNIRYVSALYSRSLFVDNDLFFPEHLQYEDNAVVTALYLASRKAVKVDAAFYYYRCNNTSTTHGDLQLSFCAMLKVHGLQQVRIQVHELHAGMICELHALSPRADQDALIRVHLLQHLTGKPDHHMVDAAVLAAHIAFLSGCRTIDDAGLVADAGKALQGGIVLVYAVLDGDAGLDVIADDAHAWIEQAVVVYDAAH